MQLKKNERKSESGALRVNTFNIVLLIYGIISCLFLSTVSADRSSALNPIQMRKSHTTFGSIKMLIGRRTRLGSLNQDFLIQKRSSVINGCIPNAYISISGQEINNQMYTHRNTPMKTLVPSFHSKQTSRQQQYRSFGRYKGRGGFSISSLFSEVKEEAEDIEEIDPGEVAGLRILKYPDPRLREKNEVITIFDEDLKTTAKNMFKIMYAAKGVGLAAPQVGINKRLLVFNPDGDSKRWLSEVTLVNPVIIEKSSKKDILEEGCLSFPNMAGNVERHLKIKVEFENLKGKKAKKVFTGWEARIFQHEYDHLEGTLYIDRLDEQGREKVQPVLDGLIETHGPGGAL